MFRKLVLGLAMTIGLLQAAQPVHAASTNFQAAAELPSNQIDKQIHYFNLLVTPGSQQELSILIQNTDSGSHRFSVSPNRAGTNGNGLIDYSKHQQAKPKSLALDIEDYLPKPKVYTVDPHSTRRIKLRLTVPNKSWSGILLGGIRVEELDPNASAQTANSRVAYNIAIELQTSKNLPKQTPQLQFNGVQLKERASGDSVNALLENPAPMIQSGLHVNAQIFHRNGNKVVMKRELSGITMAPNSIMAFPITQSAKMLKPGHYRLVIDGNNQSETWHFERDFTIHATVMKTKKTTSQNAQHESFPIWVVIGLLTIVAGLAVIIWQLKKKR